MVSLKASQTEIFFSELDYLEPKLKALGVPISRKLDRQFTASNSFVELAVATDSYNEHNCLANISYVYSQATACTY